MKTFSKISIIVLALVTSSTMAENVVIEGTFDTKEDTEACWAVTGTGGGWTDAANVSPISGGYLWWNAAGRQWNQAFDGITLMPNTLYKVSFDAICLANAQTVVAGLLYMTGSSNNSVVAGHLVG